MQYEVITVFESHCALFLMIAMHWRVVVWLVSYWDILRRNPAVVWEGRRDRVSCRWTISASCETALEAFAVFT